MNLRQWFVVITAVGLLLIVFRHPIQLLLGVRIGKAAAAPWSFFGWLFFGTDLITVQELGKLNIIQLIVFCTNVVLAVLTAYAVGVVIFKLLQHAWQWAKREPK